MKTPRLVAGIPALTLGGCLIAQLAVADPFTNVPIAGLPAVEFSSVAWGDFDNDGRLDFLLTGNTNDFTGGSISQRWRNTGNGFSNVTASLAPGLPGVWQSSVTWGDFDNDGRLDFLVMGDPGGGPGSEVCQLLRNTGGGFNNVPIPFLPGARVCSVACGDYDNDGRLDFLITGNSPISGGTISQLWRNTGSGFTNVAIPGLPAVEVSSVAWGDYDNDGRLDFLITGSTNGGLLGGTSQLWRNTGSGFSNVTASVAPGLPGASEGSVAWGDYDNDGRLDFLITGFSSTGLVSQLWRNTGSVFTNVPIPSLPGVYRSSVAWGDFDKDGRLDFLITGLSGGSTLISQLWRNNVPGSNAPPAAPAGLSSAVSGATVTLSWSAPADDHTPAAGLSYNLRIGTTPGGSDVLVPMALTSGLRLLPARGNAQTSTEVFYRPPPGRTNYWSVQAVDTSFAGSTFATEQGFFTAPLLINPAHFEGGAFEFYFTNRTSGNFEVLVSTNAALPLVNWTDLGPALLIGGGLYRFTDTGAVGQPKRFYVLRKQ